MFLLRLWHPCAKSSDLLSVLIDFSPSAANSTADSSFYLETLSLFIFLGTNISSSSWAGCSLLVSLAELSSCLQTLNTGMPQKHVDLLLPFFPFQLPLLPSSPPFFCLQSFSRPSISLRSVTLSNICILIILKFIVLSRILFSFWTLDLDLSNSFLNSQNSQIWHHGFHSPTPTSYSPCSLFPIFSYSVKWNSGFLTAQPRTRGVLHDCIFFSPDTCIPNPINKLYFSNEIRILPPLIAKHFDSSHHYLVLGLLN